MDPYERGAPRDDRPTQAWRPGERAPDRPRDAFDRDERFPDPPPPRDGGPATQAWRPSELPPRQAASSTAARAVPAARPAVAPADKTQVARREPDTPAAATPTVPATAPAKTPVQVRRLRRGRLAIRKISPWAIFKFSLVFYFCMLLIMLLGTAIIFATLKAFGVIGSIEKLLRDLDFDITISGGLIFRWFFLLGLVGTIVASAITVFMAFLYNLIADVVGGIELLVTERE